MSDAAGYTLTIHLKMDCIKKSECSALVIKTIGKQSVLKALCLFVLNPFIRYVCSTISAHALVFLFMLLFPEESACIK